MGKVTKNKNCNAQHLLIIEDNMQGVASGMNRHSSSTDANSFIFIDELGVK